MAWFYARKALTLNGTIIEITNPIKTKYYGIRDHRLKF